MGKRIIVAVLLVFFLFPLAKASQQEAGGSNSAGISTVKVPVREDGREEKVVESKIETLPSIKNQTSTSKTKKEEEPSSNKIAPWQILLTAGLTGFFTFLASYFANRCNYKKQLREKRKSLSTTLVNDMDALFSLYSRVAGEQLVKTVAENQVPTIKLIEPKQNYFAIFDNKVNELEIIDDPVQQRVILFYGMAKALYDELLEFSRKMDNYTKFMNQFGLVVYRVTGVPLDKMTDDKIKQFAVLHPEVTKNINLYIAESGTLFDDLRKLYLFVKEEDAKLRDLYNDVKECLRRYAASL